MPLPHSICAVAPAAVVASLLLALAAPPRAEDPERMVVQYLGNEQGVDLGKKVMLVTVRPYGSRGAVTLPVPNKDEKKADYNPIDAVANPIKDLKPDQYIEIEVRGGGANRSQRPMLASLKPYKTAEGELVPNVYLYQVSAPHQEAGKTYTGVVLRKLGETITAAVPGGGSPDPKMMATLDSVKAQQPVEVTFVSKGKIPLIATIDPYAPPEKATVVKATEVEVEGQKADAVELTVKGKPVTAIVTGKMQGKKWVPDARVVQMVKRLKPDQAIEARLVNEGDKTWLRYFTLEKETKAGASANSGEATKAKQSTDRKEPEKKEPAKN